MTYVVGGAVTVSVTVGPVLVPVLLEATPLESTPTMVKVYALAGVIPFGVQVLLVVLLQEGVSIKPAPTTKIATSHHAFRERFPPAAPPNPKSVSMGNPIHIA
jgi:hypothetical protein